MTTTQTIKALMTGVSQNPDTADYNCITIDQNGFLVGFYCPQADPTHKEDYSRSTMLSELERLIRKELSRTNYSFLFDPDRLAGYAQTEAANIAGAIDERGQTIETAYGTFMASPFFFQA